MNNDKRTSSPDDRDHDHDDDDHDDDDDDDVDNCSNDFDDDVAEKTKAKTKTIMMTTGNQVKSYIESYQSPSPFLLPRAGEFNLASPKPSTLNPQPEP